MQEAEAARAYDRALVRLRGRSASTNFPLVCWAGGGAFMGICFGRWCFVIVAGGGVAC